MNRYTPVSLGLALGLATAANAEPVTVVIHGTVEYNQVPSGTFGSVAVGDDVLVAFGVDSDVFVNSSNFSTRAYEIDGFTYRIGTVEVGLRDPFSGTPYFVLRDDDGTVDGFFFSTNPDNPVPLELNVPGNVGAFFGAAFQVTYDGSTLSSLNILDAEGDYDFGGLTVFFFVVQDGPFEPIGIVFESMSIGDLVNVPIDSVNWAELKRAFTSSETP